MSFPTSSVATSGVRMFFYLEHSLEPFPITPELASDV